MWEQEFIDVADKVANSFNNPRVNHHVSSNNPEYDHPLQYRPIRGYASTFIRRIRRHGVERISELFQGPLPGAEVRFSDETRALALVIGLAETGNPLLGARPRPGKYFGDRGRVYIRSFTGSGLDNLIAPDMQRRLGPYIVPPTLINAGAGARHVQSILIADPNPPTDRDVGIDQTFIFTVFSAVIRMQRDDILSSMGVEEMDRPVRYFWQALTFKAQGGSDWELSNMASLNATKTLLDLLELPYGEVRRLWRPGYIQGIIDRVQDRRLLARLARKPQQNPRSRSLTAWRTAATREINRYLRMVNFFVSINQAAVAEAVIRWRDRGFGSHLRDF